MTTPTPETPATRPCLCGLVSGQCPAHPPGTPETPAGGLSGTGFWDRLGMDEGGLPTHLPMGVNSAGQGPENDSDAHHYVCWCTDPACPLTTALTLAAAAVVQARAEVQALADEWDEHSDRLYAEARGADRDQAIVLRSKSGTYAVNAERLRAVLTAPEDGDPTPPTTQEES